MTSQPASPDPQLTDPVAEDQADLPGWAPVTPPPGRDNPDPLPPYEPPQASSSQDGGSASGRASTPASTSAAARLTAGAIGDAVASIVRGAGETLNKVTAQHDKDDIWLATDREAEAIGEPAGRIIARRIPELPGGQASDVGDLISMGIPLALYAVRNLARFVPRIMAIRKRKTPGQVTAPDMGPGPAPAPAGAPG